jgi:xanthine/uracil permease
MNSRKIIGFVAAIVIFLGVVTLFGALISFMGYQSPTYPLRIVSWLLGSLIAFTVYEWITDEEE